MEKEKAIKISLIIVILFFIVFVWVATLRYNLQGGFKSSRINHSPSKNTTSTVSGVEANIETTKQQLITSWKSLKNLFGEKPKN